MAFQGDAIFWVEVEKIVPNPFQPRREFDEAKLKELSESIRMYGILQPLTVTRKEIQREDGAFFTQYELIAGERRLRASRLAGMEQVPVIIRQGENSEQEKLELAIIENLQREDLNAVDRALAFRQLADVFDLPHSAVAKKVGRSREYVSNSIRLLGLPDYMLTSLRTADISEGHARTLLMLNDKPEQQDVIFREILLKKLSVREVERIVRKIAADKVRKKNWANTDAILIEIEREFTDTLGTRVQILKTDFGGKLTIDYFSDEDLQKLLMIVKSQGKITDFHMAGGEALEEESTTVIQKIMMATPLEVVEDYKEAQAQKADEMELIRNGEEPAVEKEMREMAESQAAQFVPQESMSVQDAIETEQFVSEALEDVIAESAQYAGEVSPYAASEEVSVEIFEMPTIQEEVQNEYSVPSLKEEEKIVESIFTEVEVPSSNYVAETGSERDAREYLQNNPKKESDDEDIYSMKNFSL